MRDIPVGNGSLLINFDDKYQIRDVYFPHVGQENHSEGFPFRFGIWADGEFSWIFSDDWSRSLRYLPETLVTDVALRNDKLGLEIRCSDAVAELDDIFLRRVAVTDLRSQHREVRVFLHHDFRIYENKVGDTAFYDPDTLALIHYKKHRYFLINTLPHFDQFATGRKAFRNSEGTWRDAEDGHLYGGAITEGSVDSTLGVHFSLGPRDSYEFYYWIAAGTDQSEVAHSNRKVLTTGPEQYLRTAIDSGRAWRKEGDVDLQGLPKPIVDLYERSLFIIRSQIDTGGAIIAATDHDVTDRATDHYSYLWPRDGAFVANALDQAGYPGVSRKFFDLCLKIVHERGYFLQKYNPDGSVGSGWHAFWDKERKTRLMPIQEDATALVLWALGQHLGGHNEDLPADCYVRLIKPCADFMVDFRDPVTKLPMPSWNLWEDRWGVHTFTCATVVAGLRAAARLARRSRDEQALERYDIAADEVVAAMQRYLYSPELGRFVRGLAADRDGTLAADATIDASLFGTFYFGCFRPDDTMVAGTMRAVRDSLQTTDRFGGVARFENDAYMRGAEAASPNTWIITTLWLAEYYTAIAETESDLARAMDLLEWTTERALPSGVLAEQIDPSTGHPVSVSPLTWSHSTFVAAVHSYLKKSAELSRGAGPAVES
ncbi:MAG: glycoside hydrolase family 15 protein [Pyrinomonadaceae bacterium]